MLSTEKSDFLYQTPRFRTGDADWHVSFKDALEKSGNRLTLDPAAVLSQISFGYVCGDRTFFQEIRRQPWLSKIDDRGQVKLSDVPTHGRLWRSRSEIASTFGKLLEEEIFTAARGRSEIYVLLSGGLDSRIVAGILSRLHQDGRLANKPISVTWGPEKSRDVVYGKKVAEVLGLEWIHVDYTENNFIDNIERSAKKMGALVSGCHFHRMDWFQEVNPRALVFAGSYGDMIGRAESSGQKILELEFLKPADPHGLMDSAVFAAAKRDLENDLKEFRRRTPSNWKHAICEVEMLGHYMRGMTALAMSTVTEYCDLYQVFTSPDVFRYIWSLHPVLRTDAIYKVLIEKINPRLAHLPWARTNRSIIGKTEGAVIDLEKSVFDYNDKIPGEMFPYLLKSLAPEELDRCRIFNKNNVDRLIENVRRRTPGLPGYDIYDIFVWLIGFSKMLKHSRTLGKTIEMADTPKLESRSPVLPQSRGGCKSMMSRLPVVQLFLKQVRMAVYRIASLLKISPSIRYR